MLKNKIILLQKIKQIRFLPYRVLKSELYVGKETKTKKEVNVFTGNKRREKHTTCYLYSVKKHFYNMRVFRNIFGEKNSKKKRHDHRGRRVGCEVGRSIREKR
jgi:hypothetical protein